MVRTTSMAWAAVSLALLTTAALTYLTGSALVRSVVRLQAERLRYALSQAQLRGDLPLTEPTVDSLVEWFARVSHVGRARSPRRLRRSPAPGPLQSTAVAVATSQGLALLHRATAERQRLSDRRGGPLTAAWWRTALSNRLPGTRADALAPGGPATPVRGTTVTTPAPADVMTPAPADVMAPAPADVMAQHLVDLADRTPATAQLPQSGRRSPAEAASVDLTPNPEPPLAVSGSGVPTARTA